MVSLARSNRPDKAAHDVATSTKPCDIMKKAEYMASSRSYRWRNTCTTPPGVVLALASSWRHT